MLCVKHQSQQLKLLNNSKYKICNSKFNIPKQQLPYMIKLNSWIEAFRLRTLPLALSSILMGSFLAIYAGSDGWDIIVLAITTTLFLQILSNLANDYGDGVRGTDNDNRVGPKRTIQSGAISPKEMKIGIIVFILLSFTSGIWLIFASLGSNWDIGILFLLLGIAAIAAAIKYTVGKRAYGYSGLGDIMVFLFFGPVAVIGTYYLVVHNFSWYIALPAATMGLLSTGVLNLNNMRDIENDAKSGKHTLAMLLGYNNAKLYQIFIISMALICLIIFSYIIVDGLMQYIYLITYPVFIRDLISITKIQDNSKLDPYLKKLAFSTLVITLLFGMGLLLS